MDFFKLFVIFYLLLVLYHILDIKTILINMSKENK